MRRTIDEAVELYGEEIVTVWTKKLAPNAVRFALAGSGQDEEIA